MNKVPKGITLIETDNKTYIETSNFDETVLYMQIVLILIPLLVFSGYYIFNPSGILIIFPILIIAVVYLIISNIKDVYIIEIADGFLDVKQGMHKSILYKIRLDNIVDVKISKKYGKVYSSARTGLTSETPNKNELYVLTAQEQIMITNSIIYSEQLFIKNKILEKINTTANIAQASLGAR